MTNEVARGLFSDSADGHPVFVALEAGEYAVVVTGDAATGELVWSIQSVPRHD